jgi:hypothetical protein
VDNASLIDPVSSNFGAGSISADSVAGLRWSVRSNTLDDDGEVVRASARSYDINEMLGTKTRALMQREQGRDLYDLFHAWQLSEAGATPYAVDGAKAMEAFAWYLEKEGTYLGADEANSLLDARLRKVSFRRDMDTLLRPGLPKFNVEEAAVVVREAYFMHLKP